MIGVISLVLGNLVGKGLGLQSSMNRLGQFARERFASSAASRPADGFQTGTIAFCAAPMALLGALLEGLGCGPKLLLTKAVLDGLATLAFARTFGWGTLLAIGPLLIYQGGLVIGVASVQPFLLDHALVDSVTFVAGFLTSFLSLVMLEIRKVPTGDYLPALIIAPLLTWYWG